MSRWILFASIREVQAAAALHNFSRNPSIFEPCSADTSESLSVYLDFRLAFVKDCMVIPWLLACKNAWAHTATFMLMRKTPGYKAKRVKATDINIHLQSESGLASKKANLPMSCKPVWEPIDRASRTCSPKALLIHTGSYRSRTSILHHVTHDSTSSKAGIIVFLSLTEVWNLETMHPWADNWNGLRTWLPYPSEERLLFEYDSWFDLVLMCLEVWPEIFFWLWESMTMLRMQNVNIFIPVQCTLVTFFMKAQLLILSINSKLQTLHYSLWEFCGSW